MHSSVASRVYVDSFTSEVSQPRSHGYLSLSNVCRGCVNASDKEVVIIRLGKSVDWGVTLDWIKPVFPVDYSKQNELSNCGCGVETG